MRMVLGVLIGGVLGYGYHRLVGCSSGACPITSDPIVSTVYGAIMGLLISHPA